MRRFVVAASVAVLVPFLSGGPVCAATQTVLGQKLKIANPNPDDPFGPDAKGTRGSLRALERSSDNTIVGDPTVVGNQASSIEIVAYGGKSTYASTELFPSSWHPIPGGFVYSGPRFTLIKKIVMKRAATGIFSISVKLDRNHLSGLVPPLPPGDHGGFILHISGGDDYCVAFGESAGGTELADTPTEWSIKNPTTEGCPCAFDGAPCVNWSDCCSFNCSAGTCQ